MLDGGKIGLDFARIAVNNEGGRRQFAIVEGFLRFQILVNVVPGSIETLELNRVERRDLIHIERSYIEQTQLNQ